MKETAEKWVFIVNPTAGNDYGSTLLPKLEAEIKKYQIDASILLTEKHGHASKLAKEALENGIHKIIAVGGDGTFNEVASVAVGNTSVTLGIIPAGTGNDFIQILGFPNRFEEKHWELFFQQQTQFMDVGSCNGTYFFNGMGLGFDAEVAAKNYKPEGEVKKGGKDKYIWHIVKTLLFYREGTMKVLNNGSSSRQNCFINTISIGRRFAGDFFLTPKAIANDGKFDVCAIDKLNLLQRFRILLKVPKGEHLSHRKVKYYQTDRLEMEFDKKVPFHVDGELYFSSKFTVDVLPKSIKIIFNPKGDHFFDQD